MSILPILFEHILYGSLPDGPEGETLLLATLAALSAAYFRYSVPSRPDEPRTNRIVYALTLFLTLRRLLANVQGDGRRVLVVSAALQLTSYVGPILFVRATTLTESDAKGPTRWRIWIECAAGAAATSWLAAEHLMLPAATRVLGAVADACVCAEADRCGSPTRHLFGSAVGRALPVVEFGAAWEVLADFFDGEEGVGRTLAMLLVVTFHVQVAVGYVGIAYLTQAQMRKNALVRLADDGEKARGKRRRNHDGDGDPSLPFRRHVARYIVFVAVPYIAQRTVMENFNGAALRLVAGRLHGAVRFGPLRDRTGSMDRLVILAEQAPHSPDAYASSMNAVLHQCHRLVERKLFSLPKLLLLPSMLASRPRLLGLLLPSILILDRIKSAAVASLVGRIEALRTEISERASARSRAEEHDVRHADVLRRAVDDHKLTLRRWTEYTGEVRWRQDLRDTLDTIRGFMAYFYWSDVLVPGIEAAVGGLAGVGDIASGQIRVYGRAMEDAVDLFLMKSRAEAQLANMMLEVKKLNKLESLWKEQKQNLVECTVQEENGRLKVNGLEYQRGTARVQVDGLDIGPGIYALTGANGSGKSVSGRVIQLGRRANHSRTVS